MPRVVVVSRWFVMTEYGEILDGPFRSKAQAERERDRHFKTYKYMPKVEEQQCKLVTKCQGSRSI